MDLIQSFSVDHTRIVPGIFLSRVDTLGEFKVTTYDIRLKKPNREPVIDVAAMHSLEHIIATYLRNDKTWKDEVIYWGPMGCLTGFYLILKGNRNPKELYDLILNAFKSVEECAIVPGQTEENCGHYLMHNLNMAKWYAKEFKEYLEKNKDNEDIYEYPKAKRLVIEEGKHFFDS
ncbi:MAG: S-ribosylhomocysteine lyase [Anaeroplasma sp.]|uniref:S-ribosylhomocysteine lyase n=1 Tax=Anaeroplasma sp. TaxID=1872523 RepID=UPI002A915E85|nr:S-ribosylhomocysteine lyase [Anaeroplasma sp.]MDY5983282.1 S-ribosylhomocysteine lyase [Anaeroplasma sp.]